MGHTCTGRAFRPLVRARIPWQVARLCGCAHAQGCCCAVLPDPLPRTPHHSTVLRFRCHVYCATRAHMYHQQILPLMGNEGTTCIYTAHAPRPAGAAGSQLWRGTLNSSPARSRPARSRCRTGRPGTHARGAAGPCAQAQPAWQLPAWGGHAPCSGWGGGC